MQIDQTTLNDLSIFQHDEEYAVFSHLNFTQTVDGKLYLRQLLTSPLKNISEIVDTQNTIKQLQQIQNNFSSTITNGTIMVMERFYDTAMSNYPQPANTINTLLFKVISSADFALTKYSVKHFISFIKGLKEIAALLQPAQSKQIAFWVSKIALLTSKQKLLEIVESHPVSGELSNQKILDYASFFRYHFKQDCFELIDIYSKIDAYISLAIAHHKYNFIFPEFIESDEPMIHSKGLYHLLLSTPVSYEVMLKKEQNFLFLTGANMAGKALS